MKLLKIFFLGFIYGWLMKSIIDEIYRKDKLRMITDENTLPKERIKSPGTPKSVREIARTPTTQPVQASSHKDDLKLIKGMGPQSEKKLNNAGIRTFAQMSRLTTTELQSILGISQRAVQKADNLIAQAKKLAQQ